MKFSGDAAEDICPISHVTVKDLRHPVGFDTKTAYECDALVDWLKKGNSCNPLTGEVIVGRIDEIVKPLIINDDDDCSEMTYIKLNQAGVTKAAKTAMLRQLADHTFWIAAQMIAFTLFTYFIAMNSK